MEPADAHAAHQQLVAIIERLGGPVEVAKLLGVSRTVPYKWISGDRVPVTTLRLQLLNAADAPNDVRLAILGMPHGSPREARTPDRRGDIQNRGRAA